MAGELTRTVDRLDRRILEELQADARISNQELAKRVCCSSARCAQSTAALYCRSPDA
jgi:DNA-binding Lrp family transcriptional regulator